MTPGIEGHQHYSNCLERNKHNITINFFIFNTFSRFSQTTTLRPLFKLYPMLWYCLQRINSFDGLHCGLILGFQFFEANGSETSLDVRSMRSLNRTKRSAPRSLRKTHVVCLLISSFRTSFSFNRQYYSLPTSALCRFGRLNCSEENFAADFFKNFHHMCSIVNRFVQ